jgi:ribonuclease P protein component
MPAEDRSLPKSRRLLARSQFLALKQGAGRKHTEHFIFLWRPNGLAHSRIGLTVTRRVAGAVGRNRVRRLLREAFRLSGSKILPPGLDLVVVAKNGAEALDFAQAEAQMALACRTIAKRLGETPRETPRAAG